MKLVYIKWVDACSNDSWHNEQELKIWLKTGGFFVEQVGFLISEDKKYIHLAGALNRENDNKKNYTNLWKIPKTWIQRRIDLTKYIK